MTTREHLNRLRRRSYIFGLLGVVLVVAGLALKDSTSDFLFFLSLVGMVLCAVAGFYLYSGSRRTAASAPPDSSTSMARR